MKNQNIIFCCFGEETYAMNKNKMVNGDYQKLAYITKHGSVNWLIPEEASNRLPSDTLARILNYAADVARSASLAGR